MREMVFLACDGAEELRRWPQEHLFGIPEVIMAAAVAREHLGEATAPLEVAME
jgi:hypothetical protein